MSEEEIPTPGSDEAIKKGCKCPVLDNGYGKGSYKSENFIINMTCKLHKDLVYKKKDV